MGGSGVDRAMERYASGDDTAFAEVYDGVAPAVRRIALCELRDRALANDVVQQTLLNLHRARGSFVPGAAVLPWACTIARHVVKDLERRKGRERRLGEEAAAARATVERPDELAIARQTAAHLEAAFQALPETQRTVLALRGRGLSLAEVAAERNLTIAAVKLRLGRAAQALRSAIGRGRKEQAP